VLIAYVLATVNHSFVLTSLYILLLQNNVFVTLGGFGLSDEVKDICEHLDKRYLGNANGNVNLLVDPAAYRLFCRLFKHWPLMGSDSLNSKSDSKETTKVMQVVMNTLIDCQSRMRETNPNYVLFVTLVNWGGEHLFRFEKAPTGEMIGGDCDFDFPLGMEYVEHLMNDSEFFRMHVSSNRYGSELFLVESSERDVDSYPAGAPMESMTNLLDHLARFGSVSNFKQQQPTTGKGSVTSNLKHIRRCLKPEDNQFTAMWEVGLGYQTPLGLLYIP
jgi:hypothetical protein